MKRVERFVVVPPAGRRLESPACCNSLPSAPGVDIVSLNVTVTERPRHYITDLEQADFSVFEDGVKQDLTFFNRRQQPIALSLLLDTSASMEDKLPMLQTAAIGFVKRLKPNDIAQVIDFDSRVEILQAFTGNQAELEQAITQTAAGGSTSLHNAIYISLKELRKVRAVNEEDVRRQALIVFSDGEDTSSLVLVRRGARPGEALGDGDLHDRAARRRHRRRKGFREAEFVLRQLAQETGGRAFFPARSRISPASTGRSPTSWRASTRSATPRRTPGATAPGAGSWSRSRRPNVTPRTKQGYFAPTVAVNLLPLVLYAAAGVAYAIHFARRDAVGRPRRHHAPAARPRSRTRSSSACRRWRCGTCRSPTRRAAISTFVWLLALSYLYLEITTDERAMGVFILPILVGLQAIPAFDPGVENARPGARQPAGSGCTCRRCCSPTPASRWPASSA